MKEKDFQTLFGRWVRFKRNYITKKYGNSIAFELKLAKGKSIRFDALREHQERALIEVENDGHYHKINDMPFNSTLKFTNKKPFDCFLMSNSQSFVVVFFYKKGESIRERELILLRISEFIRIRKIYSEINKKSVSEKDLRKIGFIERFCF